jgi:hypothetical protein
MLLLCEAWEALSLSLRERWQGRGHTPPSRAVFMKQADQRPCLLQLGWPSSLMREVVCLKLVVELLRKDFVQEEGASDVQCGHFLACER